jgi:hypothetical protein
MRGALLVVLAALAVTAGASGQRAPAYPCRAALPRGPAVPAPVVLWSDCGVFRLETSGRVVRLPRHWLARHGSGTGRRYGANLRLRWTRDGTFYLTRREQEIWRSSGTYRNESSGVAYGPGLFAVTSYPRGVFLTDLESPERLVAHGRGLYVPGFAPSGQMFVTGNGTISLISRGGALLRQVLYRPRRGFGFDEATGTIWFVTRSGQLAELRDARVRLLRPVPEPFGYLTLTERGLLVWYGKRSVTMMDRDGEVLGSSRWPRSHGNADLGVSATAGGRFFAYRLSMRTRPRGADLRLVLVRRGERRGRVVLRNRLEELGCGVPGAIRWHGHDLLYDYGAGGRVVVLNADTERRTSLTTLVRSIPRRTPVETIEVAWASDFTR